MSMTALDELERLLREATVPLTYPLWMWMLWWTFATLGLLMLTNWLVRSFERLLMRRLARLSPISEEGS